MKKQVVTSVQTLEHFLDRDNVQIPTTSNISVVMLSSFETKNTKLLSSRLPLKASIKRTTAIDYTITYYLHAH